MRRAAVTVAAALLLMVGFAGPAWAHARLIASDPAGGATVSEAPAQVTLTFSERIETSFGGVQVFDPAGARVEAGDARISGTQVRVPLQPLTVPGAYTVVFRIISGDSHPVESRFAFTYQPPPSPSPSSAAVATVPPPERPSASPAAPLDIDLEDAGPGTAVGLWTARLVNYLALTAVMGLLLVAAVLLAGGPELSALQRRAARLGAVAAGLWALSGVALFVFGLSTAAARSLPAALSGDLPARFAATRFGSTVLVQAGVAVVVATLAVVARGRPVALAALAVAGIGGVAPGWWGHAGSDELAAVALASDWAHVLAVTVWAGGLAALAAFLLRRDSDADLVGPASRFSRLAGWALAVVLATGSVNALLRISAFGQLTGTTWGRLVLLKLALFAGIAVLGWRNRHRMLPRLASPEPAAARRAFRTMALAEVGLMVLAFGAATGLASSIPADAEAAARIQSIVTAFGDGGQINLTVDPAATGSNLVHLYFLDATGRPSEVTDPSLTFRNGAARLDAQLLLSGPGHYTVLSQPIDESGDYQVTVSARVDGQPTSATGTITIR